MSALEDRRVAVVGLGYVGLPLAVALSKKYAVVGFDISSDRVAGLKKGVDSTNEVEPEQLESSSLEITDDASAMSGCDIFIVTVPTPIDEANRPDFTALLTACELVGPRLSKRCTWRTTRPNAFLATSWRGESSGRVSI